MGLMTGVRIERGNVGSLYITIQAVSADQSQFLLGFYNPYDYGSGCTLCTYRAI
jgi:hypothetical protein